MLISVWLLIRRCSILGSQVRIIIIQVNNWFLKLPLHSKTSSNSTSFQEWNKSFTRSSYSSKFRRKRKKVTKKFSKLLTWTIMVFWVSRSFFVPRISSSENRWQRSRRRIYLWKQIRMVMVLLASMNSFWPQWTKRIFIINRSWKQHLRCWIETMMGRYSRMRCSPCSRAMKCSILTWPRRLYPS